MIDVVEHEKVEESAKLVEPTRAALLKAFHVLEGASENVYDDITELAMHICKAPVALVCLDGGARSWFKSKANGRKISGASCLAFCRDRSLARRPLVIADTKKNRRTCRSEFVVHPPYIRFYAAFPLKDSSGAAIGRLLVLDVRPRKFTETQERVMRVLARKAAIIAELQKVSAHLAVALEQVKTLRQLIPICAWCKRIREDDGYWSQVEAYFHAHTLADFTHSICPACLEKERKRLHRDRGSDDGR